MNDTNLGFNFLIDEVPSLATRLIRVVSSQAHEFRADPANYIKSSLANDLIGRKRARLLMVGMAVGTIFLSTMLLVTILFYYSKSKIAAGNEDNKPRSFTPLLYPGEVRLEAIKKG